MEVMVCRIISSFDKCIFDIVCEDVPYSYIEFYKGPQKGYLVIEKNRSLHKNMQRSVGYKE